VLHPSRSGFGVLIRSLVVVVLILPFGGSRGWAQPARDQASGLRLGSVNLSGSVRTRVESSDWFGDDPSGQYSYPAWLVRATVGHARPSWEWRVEWAAPILLGLPIDAVAPAPRGALGLGANYYAANDRRRHVASLFPKQALVQFNRLGGRSGHSLTLGRYEFVDGSELVPKNETLRALKRDRIAHRLTGHFGFTHIGRSLDGLRYSAGTSGVNATVLAARPTRGVFDVNGWGQTDVSLVYGALTGSRGAAGQPGEWRLFYLGYRDGRESVVKVDNRSLGSRLLDGDAIGLHTIGGHYLHVASSAAGPIDILAWGASQVGSWGRLSHRAGALALEAGWQPPVLARLKPWIRGGYNYGSGDGDGADERHGTFFQVIPTPRVYARFPFFNMMNVDDRFAELLLRPSGRVTIRGDLHFLSLSSRSDLWYQGGGTFEPDTFGYAGRPSNGATGLATFYDVSVDATLTDRTGLTAYFGTAEGRTVPKAIYVGNSRASFGYLELAVRF